MWIWSAEGIRRPLATHATSAFAGPRGDIVAIIDADCVAHERWLGELERPFLEQPATPLVSGVFVGPQNENLPQTIDRAIEPRQLYCRVGDSVVAAIPMLSISPRRDVVIELGSFACGEYRNEDLLWCQAFRRAHGEPVIAEGAVVTHRGRDRVEALLRHQRRLGSRFLAARRLARYSRSDFALLWRCLPLFLRSLLAWAGGVHHTATRKRAPQWGIGDFGTKHEDV